MRPHRVHTRSSVDRFLGKRLLVLTAHPDDESYAFAGTIVRNAELGGQTTLVCATFGERGTSHLPRPLSPTAMKFLRNRELRAAARVLAVAQVATLGLPDGRVSDQTTAVFRRALALASSVKPAVIASFGPDGLTGHLDHSAVGSVARRLARRLRVPFLAATLPPRATQRAAVWLLARRRNGRYARRLRFPKPTLRIAIDGAVKRRALRCHRSQMDQGRLFTGYPTFAVRELLRAEYFVVS